MKILALLSVIALTGCATLTRGPVKRVSVNTNPSGATVVTESSTTFTTPCLVHFGGYMNQTVTIRKEGYEPADRIITKRLLGRIWWNVLFLPGFVVDFATGSAWRLEPERIELDLVKK